MKYRITILVMLLACLGATRAQNGFNMPFSQFGLGEFGIGTNMAYAPGMGSTSFVRMGNNFANPFNPASYAGIEMESFVLNIGLSFQSRTIANHDSKVNDADGTLDHLTIAFPILKWWKTSFGLMPYGDVSYESTIKQNVVVPGADWMQEVKTVYDGSGEVSRLYWGNGFNITKHLSAGFNINYLYGSINRAITHKHTAADTSYFMDSRSQNQMRVKDFTFDVGLHYLQPLGEHYELGVGLTCGLPKTLSIEQQSLVYTFVNSANNEYICNLIFPQEGESDTYTTELEHPMEVGMGLSLTKDKKWMVEVDASYIQQQVVGFSPFATSTTVPEIDKTPTTKLALGAAWLGDKESTQYWKRVGVNVGAHYYRSVLSTEIYSTTLQENTYNFDEFGAGLALSFPMRKGKSQVTLNLNYTSFGTLDVLRSNCFMVGLTLNSCEQWFVKRKYN